MTMVRRQGRFHPLARELLMPGRALRLRIRSPGPDANYPFP